MFDPQKYYESYPSRVILRPGYPARAQYKSTLMWTLFGQKIMRSMGRINSYADIGGCFGFGANSMAYQISISQGRYPMTKVFELSRDYCVIGKQLFPYIDYIQEDMRYWNQKEVFDLITLFDVIEHIQEPESFLSEASKCSRLALLKTPMETSGDWFGAKPPSKQGEDHPDGHINFFSPKSYEKLLKKSGWEIVEKKIPILFGPPNSIDILEPEDPSTFGFPRSKAFKKRAANVIYYFHLPSYLIRKIFGYGQHLCLVRSLW